VLKLVSMKLALWYHSANFIEASLSTVTK